MKRDLTGSSFSFQVLDEAYEKVNGIRVRNIRKVKLFDVGPVTFPAYQAADASSRDYQAALDGEKRFLAAENVDHSAFIAGVSARARLVELL